MKNAVRELGAGLKKQPLLGSFLLGSSLVTGWIYTVWRRNEYADRNIRRLTWELDNVQKELDHFDSIEGPHGMLEHSVWFHYLDRQKQVSAALANYEKWAQKPFRDQLMSMPPRRGLSYY